MTKNNLFYYPYASFTDAQLPLLKVAALWFDKLFILDPGGASWDTIDAEQHAYNALRTLNEAGILEIITPSTVLAQYEKHIAEAIRRDMSDLEFLELCEAHAQSSGKRRWTLSLAKVPQDVQTDQKLRHLMGDFARDVAGLAAQFGERTSKEEFAEYAEIGRSFDEHRNTDKGVVEYRYADFPLPLGEAIMLNHALFAGLVHAEATPLTDETFHSKLLDLKMRRVRDIPVLHQALEDRARRSQIKADDLAITTLQDSRLELPVLDPEFQLDDILEYRREYADALGEAREKLGIMAQGIRTQPWTEEFRDDMEHGPLREIRQQLGEVRKARDSWVRRKRKTTGLSLAGIGVAAASVVLSLVVAPLTPIALATAGLSLASGVAIPGAEWLSDLREGQKTLEENGLHYLLRI